jgi:predicted DNA-binding protein
MEMSESKIEKEEGEEREKEEYMTVGLRISEKIYLRIKELAENFAEDPEEFVNMVLLDSAKELEEKLPPPPPPPPKAEGVVEVEESKKKTMLISVKLPSTLYAWLKAACREHGVTQSMLIRHAIVRYLLHLYKS